MKAVDLFAGAGGFDLGAAELGLHPLGVEIDATVCETRAKAGLETLHADVAALDPADFAGCELLLASPPCPTWSAAGRGAGHQIADIVLACAAALAAGRDERETARAQAYEGLLPDAVADERHRAARQRRAARLEAAEARARREATLSLLLVEPLRFALALRPAYIACEQVPPVLPAWQAFAHLLNARGYSTWAGILNAADFGVPQTRQRAFLLASLDGPELGAAPRRLPLAEPRRPVATVGVADRDRGEQLRPLPRLPTLLGQGRASHTLRLRRHSAFRGVPARARREDDRLLNLGSGCLR